MGGGVKILYGENVYPVIKCGGGGGKKITRK